MGGTLPVAALGCGTPWPATPSSTIPAPCPSPTGRGGRLAREHHAGLRGRGTARVPVSRDRCARDLCTACCWPSTTSRSTVSPIVPVASATFPSARSPAPGSTAVSPSPGSTSCSPRGPTRGSTSTPNTTAPSNRWPRRSGGPGVAPGVHRLVLRSAHRPAALAARPRPVHVARPEGGDPPTGDQLLLLLPAVSRHRASRCPPGVARSPLSTSGSCAPPTGSASRSTSGPSTRPTRCTGSSISASTAS